MGYHPCRPRALEATESHLCVCIIGVAHLCVPCNTIECWIGCSVDGDTQVVQRARLPGTCVFFFVSYITVKCPRRLDVSQIATRRPPWVPGTENRQPVTTPGPLVPPTYRYTTRLHYRLPRSCSCRAVGPTRLSTREAAARPRCLSVILEEPGPGGSVTFTVTRDADCLARCRCRDTG